jgi:hypothetical protein
MSKPTGYLLHEGEKNGHPFAVIATLKTSNRKTGNMVQIWFILRDISPVEAVKQGLDAKTICSECPFAAGNGCYVNVGQAPLGIWKAYRKGRYPVLNPVDYAKVFSGRSVRFGAYGNPSLLPISMVKAIASVSTGWTGYFHDWRTNPFAAEYAKYFMASTETQNSFAEASRLKLRVFHASPIQPENTLECLSETKGLECASCKLCAGLSKSRLPSIWINPHGSKVARANAQALSGNN